jgi:hypothetical protein
LPGWTTGYNNQVEWSGLIPANCTHNLLRTEVETMMTRCARTGLVMAILTTACLSAVAAEDKDGGDLKKLEGKWTTPSGQAGEKVTYSFKGTKLEVEARAELMR